MDAIAKRTLRTPEDLVSAGLISADHAASLAPVADRYATAIPPALLELIHTTPDPDPLTRQFVPSAAELDTYPEELGDPIGDQGHSPVKGVVHRYPDRALLIPTLVCPVYCRFCFRREVVGPDGGALTAAQLDAALAYIRNTPKIWEVILTGGDPLILSTRRISVLLAALDKIPHVKVIRVHTRVPIATPHRIDAKLVAAMKSISKPIYIAVHCNHAAELTPNTAKACAQFIDAGIPVLSQTVLLKGVNDSVEALETLMRALVALRIKPYYLHQLDLAPGTNHFRVPLEKGQELVRGLRGRLSGLAQPTYMLDIPGGAGKVPLTPNHTSKGDGREISLESSNGQIHPYKPPAQH
jgi:lysine 2,3-aminomutase